MGSFQSSKGKQALLDNLFILRYRTERELLSWDSSTFGARKQSEQGESKKKRKKEVQH